MSSGKSRPEKRKPMSEISQYLGHTNTNITERVYARYPPDHLRDCADVFDEAMEG